jgi:hypothetical protein
LNFYQARWPGSRARSATILRSQTPDASFILGCAPIVATTLYGVRTPRARVSRRVAIRPARRAPSLSRNRKIRRTRSGSVSTAMGFVARPNARR